MTGDVASDPLAWEHRPDTGGRVSSVPFHVGDRTVIARTGDWEFAKVLLRLRLEQEAAS